jgi:DNA-binding transcriptional ArsR family regulator
MRTLLATSRKFPLVLRKPAYVLVLLAVIAGFEYPSAIARELKKKQPTVSEQLMELKAAGLIRLGKRTKAQQYVVNWDPLIYELRYLMGVILEERGKGYRERSFLPKVKEVGFERILPQELFQNFLKHYFFTLKEFRGIMKNFEQICISMFKALDELDEEKELSPIAKRFKANQGLLKDVSALIGLDVDHIEHLALQSITDELSEGEKPGQRD